MVLPFYHSGMGRILPKGSVIPRVGQIVHVTVGKPIDLSDLTVKCNCKEYQQAEVSKVLSHLPFGSLGREAVYLLLIYG